MWSFRKRENRNNDLPHIETDDNACNEVTKGVGLLHKIANLSGYDAISQSPFFAATNLISNSLATMNWDVKTYNTDAEIPNSFYALHLFDHVNVGHFMTVKNMITDVILHGNGFAYIHRDKKGNAQSIEYLPYGECTTFYNPMSRVLLYKVPNISSSYIEPINILHFKMFTVNGIEGRSLIAYAHNTVKLSGSAEKAATDYFKNGMTVQGVLSTDVVSLKEKNKKDIMDAWNNSQMGNGSGVAVLEAGVKYQPIASNSKDSQLLETRQYNVTEVSRWFNISPVLLGDLSKSSFNTLEQSQLQFVLNTLAPWVEMMEEEVNTKLISYTDKVKYYIDICEEDIVRSDKQAQVNYLTSLVNAGIITRNEARIELGFTPKEGADELVVPYTKLEDNTINKQSEEDSGDN